MTYCIKIIHEAISWPVKILQGYRADEAREFAENGTDVPQCDSILTTATVQKMRGCRGSSVLQISKLESLESTSLRIGTLPSCQWFMEGQVLQVGSHDSDSDSSWTMLR